MSDKLSCNVFKIKITLTKPHCLQLYSTSRFATARQQTKNYKYHSKTFSFNNCHLEWFDLVQSQVGIRTEDDRILVVARFGRGWKLQLHLENNNNNTQTQKQAQLSDPITGALTGRDCSTYSVQCYSTACDNATLC